MDYLTTAQAADLLGVKQDTVKRYILRDLIQARKFGRDWLIDPAEVERYRRVRRKPGRPKKPINPRSPSSSQNSACPS